MSSRSSQNLVNKWRCDLNSYSKSIAKTTDSSLDPIGYFPGFVASQKTEGNSSKNEQQQQHLLAKKAWDMALQPAKSLPMNMFMMYMAGNTISIFPIMMVVMMAWRPLKALMAVNSAFKSLQEEYHESLLGYKIIFILGNLGAIVLAIYKCHTMGLLPNHASDWLDFVPQAKRLEYVLFSTEI